MKTYYAIWDKRKNKWLEYYEKHDRFMSHQKAVKKINRIWIWDNRKLAESYAELLPIYLGKYAVREFTPQDALLERCRKR